MPPQLWMLRHGDAVPHDAMPDADRELTPLGRSQAQAAGGALAVLGLEFTAVYASPKVRAWQTAELACAPLGAEPVREPALGNGFTRVDALTLLDAHGPDAKVLVVGHEPSFSQVVHDFTGGRVDFKKGALAAVGASRTAGELLVLLRPAELAALAG